MRLKSVFVRFYKSFNFDYLRKFHPKAEASPWEMIDGMWYPYVQIPIDPLITTVVGANESGKSHLLSAIEKGLLGQDIERDDFCRYSQFFTVETGKRRWPDFGFEWDALSQTEQNQVRELCGLTENRTIESFQFFRTQRNKITIYLHAGKKSKKNESYELDEAATKKLEKLLPRAFRIDAKVALPDSVSIQDLAGRDDDTIEADDFAQLRRWERNSAIETVRSVARHRQLFSDVPTIQNSAQQIHSALSPLWPVVQKISSNETAAQKRQAEFKLARDLLCKVAKVDPEALQDLYKALCENKEGMVNALIERINSHLEASLNFPKWWVQDRNFQLRVSPREYDLVFTIRDRTKSEYSFAERSSGLKYFLSYYVQYLAHDPTDTKPEILLMDEPDAYLSSQAQQDLLKIFAGFASPENDKQPVQVIYVTHSPFLIDKNHAERIRVLEKGASDEGTRVVKDAGKNHYEPLRSAFGAFVGETTFIGATNLMVEGQSDQILLAGAATYLQKKGCSQLETLDLNRLTIVPAGSASSIPYLVYLARGRDVEQPAVIVLLDSDKSGNDAKRALRKGGAHGKRILDEKLVFQIGELAQEPSLQAAHQHLNEIEDLIPLPICVAATHRYVKQIWGENETARAQITETAIIDEITGERGLPDAINAGLAKVSEEYRIEKIGFARNVIEIVTQWTARSDSLSPAEADAIQIFETNLKVLFKRLNRIRREAEREQESERVSAKIERLKKSFVQDHPANALREQAHILFDEMLASLDDGQESDDIRLHVERLRRQYEIESDVMKPIGDYESFKTALESIKYAGLQAIQEGI